MFRDRETNNLFVEASEIGLPPGVWPRLIHVLGMEYTRQSAPAQNECEYKDLKTNEVLVVLND